MKYLGIDYGTKKVGLASSDDDGRLAFPLMVSPNDKNLVKDIVELIRELKIGTVVMGESVNAQGKPNDIAKEARSLAQAIEGSIDVAVFFEKEWYSTVEARKQPGKEGSHDVDDQAAAIVLQRHLDKVNGPNTSEEITYGDEEELDEAENRSGSW